MSRWNANFQSHAFQPIWKDLLDEISKSKIDDESVLTSVFELARLKKVVAYIDSLLNALDPELFPLGILDSFYQQSIECLNQIKAFGQNRNIGHIQNANNYADNLLGYIRPYVVSPEKAAKAYARAFKESAKEIRQYAESFNESIQDIVRQAEESKNNVVSSESTTIKASSKIEAAFEKICGDDGLELEIDLITEELKSKFSQAEGFHKKLFEGDDDEESISIQIENAKTESDRLLKEIKTSNLAVSGVVQDLDDIHKKVFGIKDDSGEFVGGIQSEYAAHLRKYHALNQEVEALLPGATSAALASSYNAMKITFDEPIKNATRLFYASISLLILVSLILSTSISFSPFSFQIITHSGWLSVLQSLASKLPVYGPIVWLAYFASKRRSEYQRLQQEYSHKEALATSFESYKKQIVELGGKDNPLLSHLLQKAVDAVAYNASESLDKKHGDRMPVQELAEKIVDQVAKIQKSGK